MGIPTMTCRQLQKGPGGAGVKPANIKNGLKKGLDCLKKGIAILQVNFLCRAGVQRNF